LLSDTLHSQKNLLFSLHILAVQAEQEKDSDTARAIVRKISELTKQSLLKTSEMLDALRDIRYKFCKNDLTIAIKDALAKTNLPGNIHIAWIGSDYAQDFWVCRFDFYHITQVFVNIFTNAKESIETALREFGLIQINMVVQFQWIIIIIKDNGTGIKKNQMGRLFEPYYSNKAGFNWGLGLSYAYKVVKAHWGQLRIESKYGDGTVVQIMLPRSVK
jgi:signal transduction histidine kinase